MQSPKFTSATASEEPYGSGFSANAAENYERYFVPTIGRPHAEDLVGTAWLSRRLDRTAKSSDSTSLPACSPSREKFARLLSSGSRPAWKQFRGRTNPSTRF